jgi:hypothetical protein
MNQRPAAFDDQLPWLQPVDDEDSTSGISARKMIVLVLIVVIGAALVAGSFFLLGRRDSAPAGGPELIQAAPGPYKIRPADPGGLDVAGESETAFETSAGEDRDARLAGDAAPREAAEPEPAAPASEPAETAPEPEPAPAPSGAAGTVIQLGAFGNSGQAERAWAALSARFPEVAGLSKMVVPYPGGIRLRAGASSVAQAREACAAVRAGGENCFIAR